MVKFEGVSFVLDGIEVFGNLEVVLVDGLPELEHLVVVEPVLVVQFGDFFELSSLPFPVPELVALVDFVEDLGANLELLLLQDLLVLVDRLEG